MKILVLRHGHSLAANNLQSDFDRELSDRGRLEISNNFLNYCEKLPAIDQVWVSPLKRAQQTADEFLALYDRTKSIQLIKQTHNLLQPDDSPEALMASLEAQAMSTVLLVTHQPLASSFIDLICGQPIGFHSMATASMALLECEYPGASLGKLIWIHHPS